MTTEKRYGYYLEIRLNEKFNGRKVWYFNDSYVCDCVNAVFFDREKCESWIPRVKASRAYPYLGGERNIKSVTVRRTRRG